jgi:RHS repeat-associated protein
MTRRRYLTYGGGSEYFYSRGEGYEYNMNGLLRKLSKFQNVGNGTAVECSGIGFLGLPIDWEYKYSPMNEREQKRKIGVGNGLPWVYYLLDGTKKPAVIYNGVETNEPRIAYKQNDQILYDDNFLYQSPYMQPGSEFVGDTVWQYIDYSTNPATEHPPKTTRSVVYMYPVEYLTYGANGHDLTWKYNGTDWIREVNVKDMLGSVRSVVREGATGTGRVIAEYDYEPFGKQIPITGKSDRLDYINKEKDEESTLGMADYGVRKYDSFTGRFMTADVLFEKYPAWNPYHYSVNNPITFRDGNGYVVIAKDENSQANIINSVEEKYRDYIGFQDDGTVYFKKDLKLAPLRRDLTNFTNIQALQYLVKSKEVVEVFEDNLVDYRTIDGQIFEDDNMDNYGKEDQGANGMTFVTTHNNSKLPLSINVNTSQVFISPNQFTNIFGDPASKNTTTAHELYGHYFLWLWGSNGESGPLWHGHEGDSREHLREVENNAK